jgi:hypothetical protein
MGVNNAPDSPTNDVSARVQLHLHNRTLSPRSSATTSKTLQPSNSSIQHPLTPRPCLHESYLTDIHTTHNIHTHHVQTRPQRPSLDPLALLQEVVRLRLVPPRKRRPPPPAELRDGFRLQEVQESLPQGRARVRRQVRPPTHFTSHHPHPTKTETFKC